MKFSWKLIRICGIDVYVHWTFAIVPAWVALTSLAAGTNLAAAVSATLFILAVFLCVLLHEFGHALMARRFGIVTRDITLLPIGGLARLERMPKEPLQELAIALAGPAVNVAISALLVAATAFVHPGAAWFSLSLRDGSLITALAGANLALAVFNLLPAFPMDGGRVLRAVLALWISHSRATRIAAGVGQVAAIGLGLLGLMGNLNLLLVAIFVYLAGRGEVAAAAPASEIVHQSPPVELRSEGAFLVLPAHARADEVTDVLFSSQNYFPVTQGGEVVGVLSKSRLLRALANHQGDRLVAELMTCDLGLEACIASSRGERTSDWTSEFTCRY